MIFHTLTIFFCLLISPALFAQTQTIKIENVVVSKLSENELVLSLFFEDFFSERLVNTLQSGLPSAVNIEMIVYSGQGREIGKAVQTIQLEYHIWQEKYRIQIGDSLEQFAKLDDVKKAMRFNQKMMVSGAGMVSNISECVVKVRAQLNLLNSNQNKKMAGWLEKSYETPQQISQDESSSGFRLSFGALVSFFMGGSKNSQATIWQTFNLKLDSLQR